MKKVISFSLWGNNPTYNIGAIKNAELAKEFYPDFECWFYIHQETVPEDTIKKLQEFNNTKIIFKSGDLNKIKPMMWRFESIDDPEVEIMLSRDTDSRFLLREKLAVNEWLNSTNLFHIMRDHPHHNFVILGGMFGSKKIPQLPSWSNVMKNFIQEGDRNYDQNVLGVGGDMPASLNVPMAGVDFNPNQNRDRNYTNNVINVNAGVIGDENIIVDAVQNALNEIARRGYLTTYAGAIAV